MPKKLWVGPPTVDVATTTRLCQELGISPVLSRVLAARGKTEPEEVSRFLTPDFSSLSSPRAFLNADRAIERIDRALREREKIVVFGDFDVDGVTGSSLAFRTLRRLGANVDYFLPQRLVHGYGLSHQVLPDLLKLEPKLVVTVDCGIRSVTEVEELRRQGVDTIVTDHHEPGPELPPAVAVVDPKQPGCPYPDKRLAGVGVIFQLLRGLVDGMEHEHEMARDLDLVALGTVADVVPLDGENRVFVSEGLKVMRRREKVGMMALLQVAGIEDRVEAWQLAYLVGPRINAAGRLGDASLAVRLFVTQDTVEATELAKRLDTENLRRQEISATTLEQALQAIEHGTAGQDPEGIVLASNAWHPGVIGIATAKLVERYHRPSALIAMDGDTGRGSVRSIRGVDVCQVLESCEDLLVQFGGHEMAAGLTIERERVPEFRQRFQEGVAMRLTEENATPRVSIDDRIQPEEVSIEVAEDLDRLGPFGFGNRRPTFVVNTVELARDPKVVGRGHLKLALRRPPQPDLDCIGFDLGELAQGFPVGAVDLVGHLSINEWNDRRRIQIQMLDLRKSR